MTSPMQTSQLPDCQLSFADGKATCSVCGAVYSWPGGKLRAKCFGPPQKSVPAPVVATYGAGTELKKLLKTVGITASPGCSCNKRAAIMDERGVEWCEQNVDEIVGWLREEATKRKLPFVDFAGRTLVKLAIRRAKKGSKG